jgi:HEAT repeat protein
MVLGMLGDPSAMKVLKPMRTDRHPAVRQQASAAMWQLGNQQGMDDLISWSISRYPDDRMMAFIGLAEPRNRSIIQHVRNGLVSEYSQVALTAARAMGMLGSDEGYGVAEKGAKSVDPAERIQAALTFGAIGRTDAQDVLKKLMSDSDTNVRIAAAEAILELKPEFVPG